MTALVRLSIDLHDLAAAMSLYADAIRRGEDAWRDVCRAVAAVHRGKLWRDATVPVGADSAERRPCKSFEEWVEVCLEKQRSWAYDCVAKAGVSAIADNSEQAQALAGMDPPDAERVMAKATEGGKTTTAAELSKLRAQDAIEQTQKNKAAARRELKQLEEAAIERSVTKALRKAVGLVSQHTGYPDWFVATLEKCKGYCEEQEKAGAA